MPWRFLVDEDTDEWIADELVERGFDAVTVASALGKGTSDRDVWDTARRQDRVLITSDRDFLVPALHRDIRVFMVAEDRADSHEIVGRVEALTRLAEDPTDLKPVTWL